MLDSLPLKERWKYSWTISKKQCYTVSAQVAG